MAGIREIACFGGLMFGKKALWSCPPPLCRSLIEMCSVVARFEEAVVLLPLPAWAPPVVAMEKDRNTFIYMYVLVCFLINVSIWQVVCQMLSVLWSG